MIRTKEKNERGDVPTSRQSTKKIIVNLQDGAEIATGDIRKGAQRDAAGNNNKNAWGGGSKKGNKMGAVEVSAPSRWGWCKLELGRPMTLKGRTVSDS